MPNHCLSQGIYDTAHPPYVSYRMPYMFSTPLRSLISKDVPNLMFAGRLASFSHVVYGSQRVMKTGSTMGQAAGSSIAQLYLVERCPPPFPMAHSAIHT
jgi:hypothetical protein